MEKGINGKSGSDLNIALPKLVYFYICINIIALYIFKQESLYCPHDKMAQSLALLNELQHYFKNVIKKREKM